MLGLLSAVGYSATNMALKGLSVRHEDMGWAIWVSAMKAVPTLLACFVLLSRRRARKLPLFPSTRVLPALFIAGLVMQFGGNLGFQVALNHIGLAITVPLVFAFIIMAGAFLGRTFLGDAVTPRTVISMLLMTVSIAFLSYAATLTQPVQPIDGHARQPVVWFGILIAIVSGISYGINGVVIRAVGKSVLPVESMLLVYSLTGVVLLGIPGWQMLGTDRIVHIRSDEWWLMILAGTFNAAAFLCVCHALRIMRITQVNVINASQNAMCAVGAVLFFAEPLSVSMATGILLSVAGLLILDRR